MAFRFEPLKPESADFLNLDALRIFAAMAVVVFHWGGRAEWLTAGMNLEPLTAMVDLFFVISGIVICHVYGEMRGVGGFLTFLRKRFARLAPLHYATLAAYVLLGLAAPLAGFALNAPEKYDMACVVPNLLWLQSTPICSKLTFNFPSWSISAEMFCYLAFPALLWIYRQSRWAPLVFSAVLVGALYAMGPIGPMNRYWVEWTFDWGVLRALPAFALGMSLYGLRDLLARIIPAPQALMYLTLAGFMVMMGLKVWIGWFTPVAYLVAVFAIAADRRRLVDPLMRALAPWGQLTFSSYMLHALFQTVIFAILFEKLLHLSPMMQSFAVVASVFVLLGVSYLSLMLFERPARRWLQGGRPALRPATV